MSQPQIELSPVRKRIAKYLTYILIFLLNAIQPLVYWQVSVWSVEIAQKFSLDKLILLIITIAGDLYILWDVLLSNLNQEGIDHAPATEANRKNST